MVITYIVAVPNHIKIFEENQMNLPTITIDVIRISDFLVKYWYIPAFLGALFDAVLLFGLSRLPAKVRWLAWVWSGGLLMAATLSMWFTIVAVSLPLQSVLAKLR